MSLPTFIQSPTERDFVQNPYPFYQEVRAAGDLFFWKDYDRVCAVSHNAVNTILRDRRWGREAPSELTNTYPEHTKAFMEVDRHSMLEREPPTHTRLRSLVVRAFTTSGIATLKEDIALLSNELIDNFPDADFDLIKNYGEVIPVVIITRLLGVPEHMATQLLSWSHDMVAMYQAKRNREIEDRAVSATIAFVDFLREHINGKKHDLKHDLLSQLIVAENKDGKLSTKELISTCILILNAGHEATVHAIGNGIKSILESDWNPETLLDPTLINATVEEILRFDPPLHKFERYAYEDMRLFGYEFERGDQIALLLAAANRDPTIFSSPEIFDPNRAGSPQLSLGAGIHFCVGAPLARMELAVALPTLFERCPNLTITKTPIYSNRYHFHGLTELVVTKQG